MERQFRRALVTGGAGFIGSHLVRALLDHGLEVTVLDDLSSGRRESVDARARFQHGDVRDPTDASAALAGVDCVFHLAAKVTIRGSFEHAYVDSDVNLMGTLNLLRRLPKEGIGQFTFASSMGVYGDAPAPLPIPESHSQQPISPYGVGKLAAERMCGLLLDQAKIPFTALRYFNTFGPGQAFTPYVGVITIFIHRLLRGEPITIFGNGEQCRDFVHVSDIVEGTVASLHGEPGVYNLGTGRATSLNTLASLLVRRIRPGARIEHQPEHPGELRYSVAEIAAAEKALGYRPSKSLETSIDGVIEAIRRESA